MVDTFSGMADRVRDFKGDLEDELDEATEDGMDTLQTELRRNLRAQDSVARRILIADIQDGRAPGVGTVTRRQVHLPDWAKFLEHGTGTRGQRDTPPNRQSFKGPDPGPPLDPILTWVIAKQLTPDEDSEADTAEELAENIVNVIAAEGTYPHAFIRPAWYGPLGKHNIIRQNELALKRRLRRI